MRKKQAKQKVGDVSLDQALPEEYSPPRPNLTLLKRFSAQGLTREDVISLARLCADGNAKMAGFIKEYEGHEFGERLPLENIIEHSTPSLTPMEFYGFVIALNTEITQMDSITLAKSALPRVIKKSIEFSGQLEGFRDREALMKIGGAPGIQPQSIQITNTVQQLNSFSLQGVPSFNDDGDDDLTREILERTLPKQLPEGDMDYIEGEIIKERDREKVQVER